MAINYVTFQQVHMQRLIATNTTKWLSATQCKIMWVKLRKIRRSAEPVRKRLTKKGCALLAPVASDYHQLLTKELRVEAPETSG